MAHQPSIKCFKTLFFAKLSLPFCLNCMFDIVIGMLMINNAFAYWKKLNYAKQRRSVLQQNSCGTKLNYTWLSDVTMTNAYGMEMICIAHLTIVPFFLH